MRHVHESYITNNFQSIRLRNDRRDILVPNKDIVRNDSRDEKITALSRTPQEIEMTDVQQTIGARCVANAGSLQ